MASPEPLIVPPLRLPHKQTFIFLHGRGSSGDKFGRVLLETPITQTGEADHEPATLVTCFPHARFVFPTAPRTRATVYNRSLTRQWFDNWHLDPAARDREELQIPGLRNTIRYVHELLRKEIDAVPGGASNVILGGLSQGCAASLTSLLLWQGEPLAAWFGVCGWLPLAASLLECYQSNKVGPYAPDEGSEFKEDGDDFDPFDRTDEKRFDDPADAALSWLREELQPEQYDPVEEQDHLPTAVPILVGHGVQDDKVDVVLGRAAYNCMTELGFDARWREYESLGHWYSPEMLADFVAFVRERTNW